MQRRKMVKFRKFREKGREKRSYWRRIEMRERRVWEVLTSGIRWVASRGGPINFFLGGSLK